MFAWYFNGQFERRGPFTTEALRQMVANGAVDSCQVVWKEREDGKFYVRADRALSIPDRSGNDTMTGLMDAADRGEAASR